MNVRSSSRQSFGSVNKYVSLTTCLPLNTMDTFNAANKALERLEKLGDDVFNISVKAEFDPKSNEEPILTGNLLVSGYKEEPLTFLQFVKSLFNSYNFYEPKNVKTIPIKAVENSEIMENSIFYAGLDIIKQSNQ